MSNIIDRTETMTPERAAKREAIRARLATEKAERDEWSALLAAERAQEAEMRERRRVHAAFQRASAGVMICHHGTWYDNCHKCQAESQRERDAEAAANR